MKILEEILTKISKGRFSKYIYIAKDYTIADLQRDLKKVLEECQKSFL